MSAVQADLDVGTSGLLIERMANARKRTDELFGIVKSDSLYERPIPERHRIIFYIGHLETFDWNLLRERVLGLKSFHSEFDRLFAFGIDPVGGGLPDDQPSDWPSINSVRDYASSIRQALDESLSGYQDFDLVGAGDGFSLSTLLNVAIEHRLMHAETLAYMLHQLPLGRKTRPVTPANLVSQPLTPQMIEVPAGEITLGLERGENFGWDNEYEAYGVNVSAFSIDRYKVTNGEYLDFINVGGYDTPAFWSTSDWNWKITHNILYPVFWERQGDGWLYRTMFEELPLPMDWPVYVSHAEANAYANWAGKRLPTEGEWHRAAYGRRDGIETAYPWGNGAPSAKFGNFDFANWNPTSVNAFPEGQSEFGVTDLLGNGWEWTSTKFGPFPGFKPFPFYRGYSADFFDGKHFVMKGGSARTAACMLRRSFRNWFQPNYQYVYAGFRCVSS